MGLGLEENLSAGDSSLNDGGKMSDLGGVMLGWMENGELETEATDLTVGKKGFTVDAEPKRSASE